VNGIEVTGYYDDDGKLIDIRVKNHIDPERYFKHHKVSLDPPQGVLEQIWDLFTFDQKYTNKANKRLQKYFEEGENNINERTKYIVVNDEDDINKIKVNNILMQKLAEIAKKYKKGGAKKSCGRKTRKRMRGGTYLTPEQTTYYNYIVKELGNIDIKDIGEIKKEDFKKITEQIVKSPGFIRILKQYNKDMPNADLGSTVTFTQMPSMAIPSEDKLNKILNAIGEISNKLNTILPPNTDAYTKFKDEAIKLIKLNSNNYNRA
jgi:hypothetical protein